MKISYFLMLLITSMALVFTACGDDGTENKDKCDGVTCDAGQACDPGSGECVLVGDPCDGVQCEEGKVCNPADGECIGAKVCDPECTDGETCNVVTGECVTPTACDPACKEGFTCDELRGVCVADDKPECVKDEDCNPGYFCNTSRECESLNLCKDNSCTEGQICDPATGDCVDFNMDDIDTIVKARMWSSVNNDFTGKLLTKSLEGVVVGIKGIKTSTHHSVVIRQVDSSEYAGIEVNFDSIKGQDDFKVLKLGDLISVKGLLRESHDKTEVSPSTTAEVVVNAEGVDLPAPIDVASVDFEEKYESMIVNVTNTPFKVTGLTDIVSCPESKTCPNGDSCEAGKICPADSTFDFTITNGAGKDLKIGTLFSYPRVELKMNENVTAAVGVLTYDWGEFKLYPRSQAELTIEAAVCDPECTGGEVCVDGECIAVMTKTIKEIRAAEATPVGGTYDTTGVVTALTSGSSHHGFFIQDAEAGIFIYLGDATPTVAIGDKVKVTGTADTFHGLLRLKEAVVTADGTDTVPSFISLAADGFTSTNDGMLVELTGGPFVVTEAPASSNYYNTTLKDAANNTFKINSSLYRFDNPLVGDSFDTLKGVLTMDYDELKLLPRKATDMGGVAGPCDDVHCEVAGEVCDPADGTCKAPVTVTLSNVRAGTVGTVYLTTGTITAIVDDGFFFQDADAGMFVYMGSNYTPANGEALGKVVVVSGELDEYKNFMELKNATVTVTGDGTIPDAIAIADGNMVEANESMYVTMTGGNFKVDSVGNYDLTISLVSDNTKTFLLKKDNDLTGDLVAGNVLSKLDGVVVQYETNYRLRLRDADDMELVEFTCSTPCKDWQACTDTDTCTLIPGRCDDAGVGCEAGYACNATVCEEVVSNDLVNGDLEAWTSGVADSWKLDDGITVTQEDTKFHGGAHSAMVTRLDSTTSNGATDFTSAKMTIDGSKNYTLSAFVLDETGDVKGRLYYALYNAAGDQIGGMDADTALYTVGVDDTTGWEELTTTLTDSAKYWTTDGTTFTAADISSISIGIRVYKENGTTGSVYLDDVTVTEIQ